MLESSFVTHVKQERSLTHFDQGLFLLDLFGLLHKSHREHHITLQKRVHLTLLKWAYVFIPFIELSCSPILADFESGIIPNL